MVVIRKKEFRAVIADTSASGFGLLMLRGIELESGHRLRVVTSEGITEGEVSYTRCEENFLYVGVRRLSEVPFVEMPRCGRARRYFRQALPTASPLIFLGVVLGFTSVVIGMVVVVDVAAALKRDQTRGTRGVTEVIAGVSEKVSPREAVAVEVTGILHEAGRSLDELQASHVQQMSRLLDGTGREWDELADELKVTSDQKAAIAAALNASGQGAVQLETRSRLMRLLT
ncbi:MAG: hypothetical protein VB858_20905, partial [Planctomycetaceae bacterium]